MSHFQKKATTFQGYEDFTSLITMVSITQKVVFIPHCLANVHLSNCVPSIGKGHVTGQTDGVRR